MGGITPGAVREQEFHQIAPPRLRGRVQGRESALLAGIGVGAALQQQADGLQIPASGRRVQRRDLILVPRRGAHVRTHIKKIEKDLVVAEEDGKGERGESVGREFVDDCRIFFAYLLDMRQLAEHDGFVEIGLHALVEEQTGNVGPAMVDGHGQPRRTLRISGPQ